MLSPSLIVTWFCFPVFLPSQEDAQEESGWKQVHGDVFRPPRKGMLLSVFLGQGTQIFIMTFITLCKDYFTLGYYLLYTRIRVSFLLTSISSFFFFSLCVSHIKYITKCGTNVTLSLHTQTSNWGFLAVSIVLNGCHVVVHQTLTLEHPTHYVELSR